ncbi:Phosphoglycerate mutase-like protein 1 [Linum perenne]
MSVQWLIPTGSSPNFSGIPPSPLTPFPILNSSSSFLPSATVSLSPPPGNASSISISRHFPHSLCFASLSGGKMEGQPAMTLYPLHRTKTIHLVRHAQGVHNVEGGKDYNLYMSEDLFDARLTELGWEQVDNLRKHVRGIGLDKKIELVVVSPLLSLHFLDCPRRTMQTAVGVFGGDRHSDGVPLMVEHAGESDRPAVSCLDCPPFMAVEQCREHLGVHPCDRRRTIKDYQPMFPAIDFSLIQNNADELWKADIREKDEEVAARGLQFFNWLWTRKEKEIAVVSHSGFLYHALSHFGNDCDPTVKSEICTHFANCELRSMVIVDRCMIGPVLSTTNYQGKTPDGVDKPSDSDQEKLP